MTSPYSDLDRPALHEGALQRALTGSGGFVSALRVLPEVDSTNSALMAAAADGAPHGSVLVAEVQTAGRGRLGRTWQAPARSGLFLSVLVRPQQVPPAQWGWLPLLAGVSARSAVAAVTRLDVALKWPNDLILDDAAEVSDSADRTESAAPAPGSAAGPAGESGYGYGLGRKLGGILVERVTGADPAAVIGIGLNVTLRRSELPAPHATSLALAGAEVTDRDTLLRALLRSFGTWYTEWAAAAGDAERSGLLSAYRAACATVGRQVRAELPGGASVSGLAASVDARGRLVIRTVDGAQTPVSAGDLVHLR
ncbi:MAG TPA: biotin--[acetyl-CoA-carboxylase] ligase [Actinocrinis sp.]|nr:biotin--[acetyl-CoA-carboxylase] ligase [Actinocrinis sp.]